MLSAVLSEGGVLGLTPVLQKRETGGFLACLELHRVTYQPLKEIYPIPASPPKSPPEIFLNCSTPKHLPVILALLSSVIDTMDPSDSHQPT